MSFISRDIIFGYLVLLFCFQQSMIVFELEICFEFWFSSNLALNMQRCIYYIFFYVWFALLSQTPVLEELFGNVHPLPTPFVVSAFVLT